MKGRKIKRLLRNILRWSVIILFSVWVFLMPGLVSDEFDLQGLITLGIFGALYTALHYSEKYYEKTKDE